MNIIDIDPEVEQEHTPMWLRSLSAEMLRLALEDLGVPYPRERYKTKRALDRISMLRQDAWNWLVSADEHAMSAQQLCANISLDYTAVLKFAKYRYEFFTQAFNNGILNIPNHLKYSKSRA